MDRWQQQIKRRLVHFEIRTIKERELFGHQEVVKAIRNQISALRECRVKATQPS